jgi:hypothetical protein
MVKRTRSWIGFMSVVLLMSSLAGCTGGDGPDGEEDEKAQDAGTAVFGSFVGEVLGTEAFVAVVAAPAEGETGPGAVQVYLSDGTGLSEWFSGPISDSSFVATSDDGDAEMQGELTADSVTGTVELPDGQTVRYQATPPSGAAGLYELTVSSVGELSGVSAAGLGVTGQIALVEQGTGMLRLVDGKSLEFSVTPTLAGDVTHVSAGQVRLIVLSDGELRGVAKGQPSNGGGSDFFIRST